MALSIELIKHLNTLCATMPDYGESTIVRLSLPWDDSDTLDSFLAQYNLLISSNVVNQGADLDSEIVEDFTYTAPS